MQVVTHAFAPRDLVAGHPALDLVNTVTARDAATPLDWLDSYSRLLDWAELGDAADATSRTRLHKMAAMSPQRAAAALARIRRFREAMHQVSAALIHGDAVPAAPLEEIDAAWKRALRRAQLGPASGNIVAVFDVERSGLDLIVDTLALSAIDLLRDFPIERARVCIGTRCGWLFIDTSKGGRRVWCDMSTCGNAAKSSRHYERRRRR